MDTLVKADVFFFITSIAVIAVTVGILIGIYYIVQTVRRIEGYAETIEKKMKEKKEEVDDITDDVKDMVNDIKDSFIYNLLFTKKRKRNK